MATNSAYMYSQKILQIFGQNIQRAREKQNYTLTKLAQISGYNRQYLSALEMGQKDIQLNTAIKIAYSLNVSLEKLFSREFDASAEGNQNHYTEDDILLIFQTNVKKRLDILYKKEIYIYTQTGIDPATTNRLLNGKTNNPRISSLAKIASGLDISLNELLSRKEGGENRL